MPSPALHEARPLHAIPSALDHFSEVVDALAHRTVQLFLDFDGTLAGIVPDPEVAFLEPATGNILQELAARIPIAILSGRERADVERRVGLAGIVYAGSHGLDIGGPGLAHQVGEEARPALERAREQLSSIADSYPGVQLEVKALGLAVHYRRIENGSITDLDARVVDVARNEPTLTVMRGKKVIELRPDVDWDKGEALMWLTDRLTVPSVGTRSRQPAPPVPMYVGDDVTDEDAFAALGPGGLSIVVQGEDDERLSLARFALAGPEQVSRFLGRLLGLLGGQAV